MRSFIKTGLALLLGALVVSTPYAQEALNNSDQVNSANNADVVNNTGISKQVNELAKKLNIPCPPFWSVIPNPSVENSLSYVHDSGALAINVTYIEQKSGINVSSESFARVASEMMTCSLPVRSNILDQAWSFTCENGIEALVYGEVGNIVLLSISGRNEKTENSFYEFMLFLRYQANRQ